MKFFLTFILIVFTTLISMAQNSHAQENHPITSSDFYTKAKVDTSFIAKINRKYSNTWMYIDYNTGDDNYCKGTYTYFKKNKNSFTIINNDQTKTDIWVKFLIINGKSAHEMGRKCFVKYNESFTLKNLKEGLYNIEIIHGNNWKQPLDNSSCLGRFALNESVTSWACSKTYNIERFSHHKYISLNEMRNTHYDKELKKLVCD